MTDQSQGGGSTEIKCPICSNRGRAFIYEMNDPPVGVCEVHFLCNKCGYIEEKAYSPTCTSFVNGTFTWNLKMMASRLLNLRKFLKEIKSDRYYKDLWRYI